MKKPFVGVDTHASVHQDVPTTYATALHHYVTSQRDERKVSCKLGRYNTFIVLYLLFLS